MNSKTTNSDFSDREYSHSSEYYPPNGYCQTNGYYPPNGYQQNRKASSNQNFWFFIIIVIAVVGILAFLNFRKSDEELILDRIDEFVSFYNDGDLDGAIECMASKQRKKFKNEMKLIEGIGLGFGLGGFSVSGSLDLGSMFGLGVGLTDGDFIKIEIVEIDIYDSKKANIYAYMTLMNVEKPAKIQMVKEKNDWYIRDMGDYTFPVDE